MGKIKKVNVNGQEYELAGSGAGELVEITYAELKALVDSQSLIPETKYRITDYVTEFVNSSISKSAMHAFDIVVTAVSNSVLSKKAEARVHDGDVYFGSEIEKWELNYNISSTTYKKGVITFLRDHNNNEASYDFKNVMFKGDDMDVPDNYFYTFSGIDSYDTYANIIDLSQQPDSSVKNNTIKVARCIICSAKSMINTYSVISDNIISAQSTVIIRLGGSIIPASMSWNKIYNAIYVKNLLGSFSNNTIDCACAIEGGTGTTLPSIQNCKFLSLIKTTDEYVKFNGTISNCVFFGAFSKGDTVNAANSVFITAKEGVVKNIDLFSLQ